MKKYSLRLILTVAAAVICTSAAMGVIGGFDYAEKLYKDAFYDLALGEYKNFINDHPQDRLVEKAYYRLISCYSEVNNHNQVIFEGNRFIQKYEESVYVGDVLYYVAEAMFENGMYDDAALILDNIRKRYRDASKYPQAILLSADMARRKGDESSYVSLLKEVLNLNPGKEEVRKTYLELSRYYFEKRDAGPAWDYLKRLEEKDLEPGQFDWMKGEIEFLKHDYDAAYKSYASSANRFPGTGFAYRSRYGTGLIMMKRKEYDKALELFAALLKKDPNGPGADEVLKAKVDCLLLTGKEAEAASEMEYFLKAYGDSAEYGDVAEKLIALKKTVNAYEDAVELYGKYIDVLKRSSAEMGRIKYLEMVSYMEESARYEDAVNALIDLIGVSPGDPGTPFLVYRVGRIYYEDLKDYDKAAVTLERLGFDEILGDKALYMAGMSHEAAGRFDDAVNMYEKLISRFGFSPLRDSSTNRIDYLNKYVIRDSEAAINRLDSLLEKAGGMDKTEIDRERGDIFFALKDFSRARDYFGRGADRDGRYYLASVYAMLQEGKSKDEIRAFFLAGSERYPQIGGLYPDVLVYYRISGRIDGGDYLFYFTSYPEAADGATVRAYIDYLIGSQNFAELKDFKIPAAVSPDSPAALYVNAMQSYYSDNFGEAEYRLRDLRSSGIADSEAVDYYLAEIYCKTGREEQAEELLTAISENFELRIKASLLLSKVKFDAGDYRRSVYFLYNVLKRKPEFYADPIVMGRYSEALSRMGDMKGLAELIEKMDISAPGMRAVKGLAYIKSGMDDKGISLLKGEDADVKSKVYEVYAKNNRWGDVMGFFDDGSPYSLSRVIIASGESGMMEKAERLLRENRKKTGKYTEEISYHMANGYMKTDKAADARKYLDMVLKSPNRDIWFVKAKFMYGNLLLAAEDYDKALRQFADIEDEPLNDFRDMLYLSMGHAVYKKGDTEAALDYFSRSYEAAPNADALYNTGVVRKIMEDGDAAREAFRGVIERFPDSSLYYDAYLNYIYTFMDDREYDKALAELNKIIDKVPDTLRMEVQYHIGDCLYGKGEYRDSVREFMKVKYIPVNGEEDFQWMVTALFQAGNAYESLNEIEKAVEIYEEIIRVSGKDTVYMKTAAARIEQLKNY